MLQLPETNSLVAVDNRILLWFLAGNIVFLSQASSGFCPVNGATYIVAGIAISLTIVLMIIFFSIYLVSGSITGRISKIAGVFLPFLHVCKLSKNTQVCFH